MNRAYLFLSAFCLHQLCFSQNVGIGINPPNAAAKLEVFSNNSGVLIPRLSTAQKTSIVSPPAGLLVYDNNLNRFSFFDGSQWTDMKPTTTSDSIWYAYQSNGETNVYNQIGQHFYIGGTPILPVSGGGGGSTIDGVLRIGHSATFPFVIDYFLSMDGKSLQARTKSGGIFSPQVDANLVFNPFGGNVGVGLSSPTRAKFQVQGYVGNTVGFFSGHSTSQGIALVADYPGVYFNCYFNGGVKSMGNSGYASSFYCDQSDGSLIFNLAPSAQIGSDQPISLNEAMRITKEGRVGIGTTNPSYPLSVNGQIQSKEIRVETGWSDYVFEKNYKLRSLKEIEQFIKQFQHLPGIPAAKEIQDNGLAVGEMNTKMMEKIEELTLYVIQLEKKINRQQLQLQKQEQKLSSLQKNFNLK